MSADYLDLLLTRENRAAPLAEPRIESGAAALAPPATWGEITGEQVVRYRPPIATDDSGADVQSSRAQVEPPAHKDVSGSAPRRDAHIEEPATPGRQPPPDEAGSVTFAKDVKAETRLPDTPIQTERARSEPTKPPLMTAEPAPRIVPTERWFPPAGLRQLSDPLGNRMRHMDPAPKFPLTPPAPQAVTIRIDRIEVRAAPPAAPAATPKPRPGPRLGLDEYLKRRSGGGQ